MPTISVDVNVLWFYEKRKKKTYLERTNDFRVI